jgi:hypothetical protein
MLELRLRSRTAGLLPRASSTTSARPTSHSNAPLEGVWADLAEGLEQFTLTAVSIGWRRPQRYQRAHETIQITQALWGS